MRGEMRGQTGHSPIVRKAVYRERPRPSRTDKSDFGWRVARTSRMGQIRFWVPHSFAFCAKGWETRPECIIPLCRFVERST